MFHFDWYYMFIFIPVVVILYTIVIKHEWRKYVLLLASMVLFYSISKFLLLYVIGASIVTYFITCRLKKIQTQRDELVSKAKKEEKKLIKENYNKKQKRNILVGILLLVGTLVVLKYTKFFLGNVNSILKLLHISTVIMIPKFLLPIGISFYTLEAVSYIIDVYHEKTIPTKNFFELLLYLSFFAYLIEGPITRYDEVKDSLFSGSSITYQNLTFGIQRIAYGAFKKMVIADRLNMFIKLVFNSYKDVNGTIALAGAIFYTIQLYMEFSGTMDVAIGTAEIFGIKLPENFRNPFFSKNISEFWMRWHITLGHWFKDYIFYPVSLSKPVKKLTAWGRKRFGNYYGPVLFGGIALFCVWILNGLWHGPSWKYIFFGLYHFTLIFTGSLLSPHIKNICQKLKINSDSKFYHALQIIKTSFLVVIGELIFRADGLRAGFTMIFKIFTNFRIKTLFNGALLVFGLDICDYIVLIIAIAIVLYISILREKGKSIREIIASKNICIRWTIYIALVISIVILGAYGANYAPVEPIYAEF